VRKRLLSNIWCGKCRHEVTITNFSGAMLLESSKKHKRAHHIAIRGRLYDLSAVRTRLDAPQRAANASAKLPYADSSYGVKMTRFLIIENGDYR